MNPSSIVTLIGLTECIRVLMTIRTVWFEARMRSARSARMHRKTRKIRRICSAPAHPKHYAYTQACTDTPSGDVLDVCFLPILMQRHHSTVPQRLQFGHTNLHSSFGGKHTKKLSYIRLLWKHSNSRLPPSLAARERISSTTEVDTMKESMRFQPLAM